MQSQNNAENTPYCLVLDTNIWVSERLLQSFVGSAVLYAVAESQSCVGLPEIVEMEVNRVLQEEGKKAAADLRKNVTLLRQLSGHQHHISCGFQPTKLFGTE